MDIEQVDMSDTQAFEGVVELLPHVVGIAVNAGGRETELGCKEDFVSLSSALEPTQGGEYVGVTGKRSWHAICPGGLQSLRKHLRYPSGCNQLHKQRPKSAKVGEFTNTFGMMKPHLQSFLVSPDRSICDTNAHGAEACEIMSTSSENGGRDGAPIAATSVLPILRRGIWKVDILFEEFEMWERMSKSRGFFEGYIGLDGQARRRRLVSPWSRVRQGCMEDGMPR